MANIAITNVPLERDEYPSALKAAEWIMATHPSTLARVQPDKVELSGPYPTECLANMWRSGLANEMLIEKAAGDRAAVLEALVR